MSKFSIAISISIVLFFWVLIQLLELLLSNSDEIKEWSRKSIYRLIIYIILMSYSLIGIAVSILLAEG